MRVHRFVTCLVGSTFLPLALYGCSSPNSDGETEEETMDSGPASDEDDAGTTENDEPDAAESVPDAEAPTSDEHTSAVNPDAGATDVPTESDEPEDAGATTTQDTTTEGTTSHEATSEDTTSSSDTSETSSDTLTSTTTTDDQTSTAAPPEDPWIEVTEANGQEESIDLVEGTDPTTIVVILTPVDEEEEHPVPSKVQNGQVNFHADEPGIYTAKSVRPAVPNDCLGETLDTSVSVQGNLDADLLEGVSRIQGNLTISGDTTDLSPLRCLTEITGNLDITSAAQLTAVDIPNLAHVRGRLYVYNDAQLTSLQLPNLQLVDSVALQSLPEITKVSFPQLINPKSNFAFTSLGATADDALSLGLGWLVSVPGDLNINTVANLETLEGFEALQEVGGGVDVRTNATLTDATGLARLESVGAGVTIYNNAELTSITLTALARVGGANSYSLNIQSLPELTSLEVGALEETPGIVYLYQLGSTATDALDVDLSSLTIVRNDLTIQGVANIVDLDGFAALEQVTGTVDIRTNQQLESAAGLAALEAVTGRIVIYDNEALETVSLASLSSVGNVSSNSLNIQALPELVSLDVSSLQETDSGVYLYQLGSTAGGDLEVAFDALEIIRGNLDVQQVANITSLDAFAALTDVTGSIDVRSNETLTSAAGFAALETVGGGIVIYTNPELTEISLASLTEIGEVSSQLLNIQTLPELRSLDVGSLVETPSQIYLYDLGGTANGDLALDFTSLEIVRSTLTFSYIDNIANVDAFASLEEIGGNLVVDANLDLVSFSGFDQLATLDGALYVRSNPLLSECLPLELRNRLEEGGFDGTVSITGNLADTCD